MKRRLLSIVLMICMIVSMLPVSVLAADGDPTINYVSLGDSMANGYGLDDNYEHNGYNYYGGDAYPNQFATWLSNEKGVVINHSQYAMSGMRVEDLHFTLELDYDDPAVIAFFDTIKTGYTSNHGYCKRDSMYDWADVVPSEGKTVQALFEELFSIGDLYTYNEFIDGRFNYYDAWEGAPEGTLKAAEAYQTAVKNADIISVGIGNGNFGVFMLGRIMEAIGFDEDGPLAAMQYDVERALAECEPEMQDKILMMKEVLYADLETFVRSYGMSIEGDPMMEALVNTVVYTAMSFALNYAGTLERIMELNPDAEVILVGIMNTFAGIDATMGGAPLPFSMTDLMGVIVKPANAFIAAIPTMMQGMGNGMYDEGTFYYAEAPEVECVVETYSDEIYNPYNKTVRDRFITEIVGNGYDKGMIWGLAGGLLGSMGELVYITRTDIENYEAAMAKADAGDVGGLLEFIAPMMDGSDAQKVAAKNKLISIIVYLGFEQCVLDASEATTLDIAAFASLASGDLASAFGPLMYALAEPQAEDFETVEEYEAAMAIYKESLAIIAQYNDIVYALVAALSDGMLTAEQVEDLLQGGDAAEAVYYAIVAGFAGITAEEVDAIVNEKTGADDALYKLVAANLPDEYSWLTVDMIKAVAKEPDGDAAYKVYYALVEQTANLSAGSVANIIADNDAGKAVLYAMVEQTASLPEGSVANIVADNDAGKAVLYALVEAQANLPEGSVANIVADNDAGKAVLYAMVEQTANLPEGSVANIVADNDAGKEVLYAIVAQEMSTEETPVTVEQIKELVAGENADVLDAVAAAKKTVVDGIATAKQTVVDGIATAKQTVVDGIATAKQTVTEGISTAKNTAIGLVGDGLVTAEQSVVEGVATAKTTVEEFDIEGNVGLLGLMVGMPEVLPAAAAKDYTLTSLLHLFARMMIGNGLGAHPSATGHDDLYAAVKASYDNGHTAEDETDKRLEEIEHAPVAKEIYLYLAANDYIDEYQTLDIAWFVYQQYRDDQSLDGNLFDIIDFIYSTLFNNEELNDDDRLAIISGVYNILKDNNYLTAYEDYLGALEEIIAIPVLKEKIPAEKTFDLVELIYDAIRDGEFTQKEIREIIGFVYFNVLDTVKVSTFSVRASVVTPTLTVEEKIDVLEQIFDALKNNLPLDTETYPQLAAVETLYDNLTALDADGDQIVPDAVLNDLFDKVVAVVADPAQDLEDPEVITAVAADIADTVLNDERIKPANKVVIIEEVTKALEDTELGGTIGGGTGEGGSSYDLAVIVALRDRLEAAGYLTAEQQGEIIEAVAGVLPTLMAGQQLTTEEMTGIADEVYGIVFNRADLTFEDKIAIVVITFEVLEEYGYVADAYELAMQQPEVKEKIEEAIKYLDIAMDALLVADNFVHNAEVSAELEATRALLQQEISNTIETLYEIRSILANSGDYDVDYAAIMTLEENLNAHYETIMALAAELEIVITPYVVELIDAVTYYSALVNAIAHEVYARVSNGVEEFTAEYAAWVEEMGKLADQVDPVLGAAVREYLTETPAEALAILYAYGDEALTKLMVDAAAAGKDIYTIAAALAELFYEYGEDIYDELLGSEEYDVIKAHIEALKAEIEVVLEKVGAAPTESMTNYEETLGELYTKLMNAYADTYTIVLKAAGQVDAALPAQIDTLMTALIEALGVAGNTASQYGGWLAGHADAMAGALLSVLVENTDELLDTACPIIDEIIRTALTEANEFLYETCKAIDAQIWVQIGILETELKALKAELENAAGEAYDAIMAQIAVVEAKIAALKAAVEKGIYTNYLAAVKAIGELKNEVINLANALKAAAMDEAAKAYDGIVDALADLEKALPTVLAEALETVKEKLGQFGEYLTDKIVEAVKKYAPELADAVYNYLYNNPAEVITFVTEYGPYLVDFAEEYGDEALALIGVVFYLYGEDIVDYVVENHEAILGAIANWIDVHGENTAELIQVYAEALGLCGAVREQIAVLENAVLALEAEAQAQIAALQAQIAALNAQLQTATGEAKAEIEAKIAELEAQIEAINATVEAKIAEVKAAIAELEAAVEATIEKGLADIAALKAAIDNLDEKVAELIAAAKQAAIEEIKAAAANVDAALKNLDATVEELVGEVYVELKVLLGNTVNELIDATVKAAKKYAPELADTIYDYLYNNPDEVIAFFTEYGDEILALAEKYGDEALMAVGAVMYLYGDEIAAYIVENDEQLLMSIANWISVHGGNAAELLQVYAEALGLCDLVRGEITELEQKLAELEAELNKQLNTLNNVLMSQLAALEAELALLNAELQNAVEAQKPAIEAAIAEIEKQIAEIEDAIEEVKALIAEIQNKIEEIKALLPELNEKLQNLVDSLFDLDAALNYLIEVGFDLGAPVVQNALNAVADAVKALVGVTSDAAAEELTKLIEKAKQILDEAYWDATHTDIVIDKDSYYVGLGDDLSAPESFVELLAEELGVDFNNLAVEGLSMTDLLYILNEDFVADEYTLAKFELIYQQTGYTVEQMRAVYTSEIAKADLVSVGVGSFGITDFIYAQAQGALAQVLQRDLGEWLSNKYFGATLTAEMSKYVDLEATTYEMDWVSYIGEDGVEELNKVLADVHADLIEKGIPETYTFDIGVALELPLPEGSIVVNIPVADLITMMAESYMYAYVTHLYNAGEAFNIIHEIAPEAELLVIGMFNPMDEVVLNFGDVSISLGDYYTYMVDVMNLRYLGYAFVAPNTTFIAVPDTQTTIEQNVEDYANLEEMLMALAMKNADLETDVVPTPDGHEYIKDQIINALTITTGGLLGDVDDNGVVDSDDAMWILKYDVGMDVDILVGLGDVDGNGSVDSDDAMWILKYDVGMDTGYPIGEVA